MKARRVFQLILSAIYIVCLLVLGLSPLQRDASAPSSPLPDPTPAPRAAVQDSAAPTVDFRNGSFPSDAQELTLVLSAEELPLLERFSALKRADLSGSECLEEILAWAEAHPQVELRYSVPLGAGLTAANDASSLDLSSLTREEAAAVHEKLRFLPALKSLDLGSVSEDGPFTGIEVAALHESYPDLALDYTMNILGRAVSPATESIDLSAMTHENAPATAALLSSLPELKSIQLGADDGRLQWEDVAAVRDACPNAVLSYAFKFWDKDINLDAEELNFSHVYMGDEGESVQWLLPFMRNLKTLDMDTTGISNAAMRGIRDAYPAVNVIWRVNFAEHYSVRTDVIKILASKPSKAGMITDKDVDALSCCTKLKYIDIGHNETLHDISFCSYMPDLEVAIFTMTGVSDISPLANCPHLEYLEVTHTTVSDLSPLANAKELRHLNIGDTQVSDITALYGLTDLERLYICLRHHVPQDQIDTMKQLAPDCEVNTDQDDPSLGAWRFADLNDEGWAYYVKTGYFKYENHPRYELLREQFGYDTEAYAFSWLDPLY